MRAYDVIVLGVGGMGSAACEQLARRGQNVLGIEQFHPGHDRGSSHGRTRIIRKAYFEHPDYVPLLHEAYRLWRELESDTGRRLYEPVGLLLAGRPEGAVISGVQRAARAHGLAIEALTADAAARRFLGFRFADGEQVLFEPDAGFLRVEECVHAHIERAVSRGATILAGQRVREWSADDDAVRVTCDAGAFNARRLVITAGAWSAQLLTELGRALHVRRKVQLWFRSDNPAHAAGAGAPAFCFDESDGFFYGFPALGEGLMKIAEHSGGQQAPAPEAVERALLPEDLPRVQRFIAARLPGVRPLVERHSVCLYTMTPDEHFIIDRHPRHANVFVAAGFSGHGFKFAPLVGSVLADLVTTDRTAAPIGFLSAARAALRQACGGAARG